MGSGHSTEGPQKTASPLEADVRCDAEARAWGRSAPLNCAVAQHYFISNNAEASEEFAKDVRQRFQP